MRSRLQFNSTVLIAFAGLFVFVIHNLSRLRVSPFRLDPCDAVMHFAVFTIVLALVGSLRALLPYQERPSYEAQNADILRSQGAVVMAIFVAFSAYAVGLAKHPSMWVNAEWRNRLIIWLAGSVSVVLAVAVLILGARPTRMQLVTNHCGRAVLASLSSLAALVFCPEYGGGPRNETAHILTVSLGALIVFVPMTYLLPVLVPYQGRAKHGGKVLFTTSSEQVALAIGLLLGAFLFWVDAHRNTLTGPLLPALKPIGPVMGLLIAYAFLAEELGLIWHLRAESAGDRS